MMIPPTLQLSVCVTPKEVPHLSQWLWRFTGETLYRAHKKFQNSIADSTVPESLVPHTLSHASVLLSHIIRRLSVPLRSLTKPLSLDSHMTSQASFPSRCSSLRVHRWSALETPPPPTTACTISTILRVELTYFSFFYVTRFRSPSLSFLTLIVIIDPTTGRDFSYFWRKDEAKKFRKSSSPLLRTSLLCPR